MKQEDLPVKRRSMEFLYADGDQCLFMNPDTYEQTEIAKAMIRPQAEFLERGMRLSVEFVEDRSVSVSRNFDLAPDDADVQG